MNSLYFAFCVFFCLHILVPTDQSNLQKKFTWSLWFQGFRVPDG